MENTNDFFKGQIPTIILNILSSGDKYGYEIIKEAEEKSNGNIIIKQPSLYSCLKRLETQKLISSYWMDSDIGGKRHYYRITDMGKKQLEYNQETLMNTTTQINALSNNINKNIVNDSFNLVTENNNCSTDTEKIINDVKHQEENSDITETNTIEYELNSTPNKEKNSENFYNEKVDSPSLSQQENYDTKNIENENNKNYESLKIEKSNSVEQKVIIDTFSNKDNVENKFEEIKNDNFFTKNIERDLNVEKAKNKLFFDNENVNTEKNSNKEKNDEINFENKAFLQCKLFENTQNINISNLQSENQKITLNFEDKKDVDFSYNNAKNNLFNNKSFFENEKNTKLEEDCLDKKQELNSNLYNKINLQNNIISNEKVSSKEEILNNINNLMKTNNNINENNNIEVNSKEPVTYLSNEHVTNLSNDPQNEQINEPELLKQQTKSFTEATVSNTPVSFITETISYVPKVKKLDTPSLDLINNNNVNFENNKSYTSKYFKGYYDKFETKEEFVNKEIKVEVDKDIILPIKNKENVKNNFKTTKLTKSKEIKSNEKVRKPNLFKISRSNLINYNLFNVFTFLTIFILASLESLLIYLIFKNNSLLNPSYNFLFLLLPCIFLIAFVISLIIYSCNKDNYMIKEDIKHIKNSTLILIFILLIIIYFGLSLSLGLNGNNIKDYLVLLILPTILSTNIMLINPIKFLVSKIKLVYKAIY